jgi:hypothetical protein
MHPETVKMLLALYGPMLLGLTLMIIIFPVIITAQAKKEERLDAILKKETNERHFLRKKPRLATSRRKKAYKRRF